MSGRYFKFDIFLMRPQLPKRYDPRKRNDLLWMRALNGEEILSTPTAPPIAAPSRTFQPLCYSVSDASLTDDDGV